MSHTTVAAKELGRRCEMPGADARTLHSVCYHLLNLSHAQVVSPGKLHGFGKLLGLDLSEDNWPTEAMGVLALAECTGQSLEDAYAGSSKPCGWHDLVFVVDAYRRWKSINGFIDFSDMLTRAARMRPEPRWSKLFIDEAQDFSPVAWEVVRHLVAHADDAVVAGDDDQAIYEWSGADPHAMDNFINDFGSDVEVLDRSWRVPVVAHGYALKIAARIRRRLPKVYRPTKVQGTYRYITSFDALRRDDLRGTTVLYRDKSTRSLIDERLRELGMSYSSVNPHQPAPYDKREARSLRIMAKMRDGKSISAAEAKALRSSLTQYAWRQFESGGIAALDKLRIYALFDSSPEMLEYLERVDVTKQPDVMVSTVHGFKGAEADHVILCTGMSARTAEGYTNNPDPEHRVWYVGVTRTRDSLTVVGGENEYSI